MSFGVARVFIHPLESQSREHNKMIYVTYTYTPYAVNNKKECRVPVKCVTFYKMDARQVFLAPPINSGKSGLYILYYKYSISLKNNLPLYIMIEK